VLAGNGGFVGATGTEIHTGELTSIQAVPHVFPKVRLVFFCLVDVDGKPYLSNICPETLVPDFNATAAGEFVGKSDWDIAEIK
jgi:hypothetical protein